MLLALDTSTPWVSVALHDGRAVVAAATSDEPMRHGERLAPMIASALAEAGADRGHLTALAAGVGPGAFTGLRVGLVTARTLGLALGLAVFGVCSLDVLAREAIDRGVCADPGLLATIDARRKELFWAVYDAEGDLRDGLHVGRPDALPEGQVSGLVTIGAGPGLYPDAFDRVATPEIPSAVTLARMVVEGSARLLDPEPIYLRRPDAVAPGPRKRVS